MQPHVASDVESLVGNNTMTRLFHLYFRLNSLGHSTDPRQFQIDKRLLDLGTNVTLPNGTTVRSIYRQYPENPKVDDDGRVTGVPTKNEESGSANFTPVKVNVETAGDGSQRYYLFLESVTQLGTKFHYSKSNHEAMFRNMTNKSGNPPRTPAEVSAMFDDIIRDRSGGTMSGGAERSLEDNAQADHVLVSNAALVYKKVSEPLKLYRNSLRKRTQGVTDGRNYYKYSFLAGREQDYIDRDAALQQVIADLAAHGSESNGSVYLEDSLEAAASGHKITGEALFKQASS